MDSRPNIVYIVCHDIGRHLGCYGRGVRTPHLDRFASQGIRFDAAYANSAVCSPSRGCAMTGLPAHQNGIMGLSHFGWRFFPGVRTIVDEMNDAGYETIHCGLSHEGDEGDHRYQIDFEVSWESRMAARAVDDAIAVLRSRRDTAKPFYMNVGFHEAHQFLWSKDTDPAGFPSYFRRVHGDPRDPGEVMLPPQSPDTPAFREMFARFETSVTHMDAQAGRLFATLDETGLSERTWVVFTTDHGVFGLRAKSTLYGAGTEIALLIRPPGPPVFPSACHHLIQNIDFFPTFSEIATGTVPRHLPGQSLLPLLQGKTWTPHPQIFQEWNFGGGRDDFHPSRAIRTRSHLFIHNFEPRAELLYTPDDFPPSLPAKPPAEGALGSIPGTLRPAVELYDLASDPGELQNIAEDPRCAVSVAEFESRLHDHMVATSDFLLGKQIPVPPAAPGFAIPPDVPRMAGG